MEWVEVSREMISLIGAGPICEAQWPADAVGFVVTFGQGEVPAAIRYLDSPTQAELDESEERRIILLIARAGCERLLGNPISLPDGGLFHLSPALRAIALSIRDYALLQSCRETYRLAKSLELLCEILRVHAEGGLMPLLPEAQLSRADVERLLAARRMIEDHWPEKLTLDIIARAVGLNRAKLTRGYKAMFDTTVADAIANQRLGEAGSLLRSTDLPVSSIGYRCGYLNNASFTRAFARHFGVAPTQYRASMNA